MAVLRVDISRSVQDDPDPCSAEFDPQGMPYAGCDRRILVLDCPARSGRRVGKRHVSLERIGTSHIIIVSVFPAPDQSTRLVLLSCNRFEFDFDRAVHDDGTFP